MSDFPRTTIAHPAGAVIHTAHPSFSTHNLAGLAVANYTANAWPAANLGIYVPFVIDEPSTVRQMAWENGGVAGTTDIGIYDRNGKLLVSLGATTNAGSIQVANIADTALPPGLYYAAMVASTVTTQTYWSGLIAAGTLRCCGVQQQAIGAATLPATATFAAVANGLLPFMAVAFQAVM